MNNRNLNPINQNPQSTFKYEINLIMDGVIDEMPVRFV